MKRAFLLIAAVLLLIAASALYAEEKAQSPQIAEWKTYLKSLDAANPASIKKAAAEYNARFGEKSSQPERDAAFMAFRSFYYDVIDRYESSFSKNEKIQAVLWDEKKGKSEREKLRKTLSESGMTLMMSEGTYYIGEDTGFLAANFASQLSPGLREFLTMRSREMKKGFTEDAGLLITWNELADRIAAWDRYLKKYGDSSAAGQAEYYDNLYLAVFLTGIDNSRVFSMEKGALDPAVQKAYEYYLKTYSDTKSAAIIEEYYSILKKNGLKESQQSKSLLKKYKLIPMTGIQPPVR